MDVDRFLRGRAEVERRINDAVEGVTKKAWADFYGPMSQETVRAAIDLKRDDGTYVLPREEIEHEIARSYWRQREGLFGLTIHGSVEVINDAANVDWWSRSRES